VIKAVSYNDLAQLKTHLTKIPPRIALEIVNTSDEQGKSLIILAASNNSVEIAKALIEFFRESFLSYQTQRHFKKKTQNSFAPAFGENYNS
jgi:ankyrin repeat protein